MKNFSLQIALFSVVVGLATWLAGTFLWPGKVDIVSWMVFAYFIVLTSAFHYGLLRSAKGNAQAFIRYYMASTTFKLLLHIGVILIYSLFHKEDAVRFIVTFLVMYILFTGFEVAIVYRKFRP